MLFRELLGPFGSMRKLFGVFLSHFENSTEFSVLFSVLFPEIPRIWEISRILGAALLFIVVLPSRLKMFCDHGVKYYTKTASGTQTIHISALFSISSVQYANTLRLLSSLLPLQQVAGQFMIRQARHTAN